MPGYIVGEEVRRMPDDQKPGAEHMEIFSHLNHVAYPATKQDLVQACQEMSDVPEADKEWFAKNLPDKTYERPEDVKQTLMV